MYTVNVSACVCSLAVSGGVSHVCSRGFLSAHPFSAGSHSDEFCQPLSFRLQKHFRYRNPLSWSFLNPACMCELTSGG